MKKIIKIMLILITIIAVFIGIATALLATKANQDVIKNKIIQIVHDKTGNELTIGGDIQWSFFPLLGVKIHDVALNKIARAGEASFSVELLPLFLGRISLGCLILKDFNLRDSFKLSKLNLNCENISFGQPFKIATSSFSGDLEIDAVQLDKLSFSKFYTKIISNNGLIDCQKIGFVFYHGKVNGNAVIDVRSSIPQLSLKLMLDNAAIRPLLIDVANYSDVTGNLTLNTNISMRGTTGEKMLNSLSGSGDILISTGSYQGVDIPFEVRRASAILNQKEIPQSTQPPHTDFSRLTASFRINNALLYTNDLLVQSPDYTVTGQGNVNMVSQQLDLLLNTSTTHDKSFFVPIKIFGSLAKPSIRPDTVTIMRQVVKKEVQEQVEKQLEKLNIPKDILNVLSPLDKLLH